MSEETAAPTDIAKHGARRLSSVDIDSFNIEVKEDNEFIGDRARKGAFSGHPGEMPKGRFVHLAPSWIFEPYDSILAVDVGDTNIRCWRPPASSRPSPISC